MSDVYPFSTIGGMKARLWTLSAFNIPRTLLMHHSASAGHRQALSLCALSRCSPAASITNDSALTNV